MKRRTARQQRSTERFRSILVPLGLISALAGCGTPITTVRLEPLQFEAPQPKIEAVVGLCLPKAVRGAAWRNQERAMVQLGSRFALNLERMADAAFRDVEVSFATPCDVASDQPRLESRIIEAERSVPSWSSRPSRTTIAIETNLIDETGATIWSETARHVVENTAFVLFRGGAMAAKDFGEAMELALDQIFVRLMSSQAVRRSIEKADGPGAEPLPTGSSTPEV